MTATLADLQKRNQEQMRQAEEVAAQREEDTDVKSIDNSVPLQNQKPVNTDLRKPVSTEVRKGGRTDASEEVLTHASKDGRADVSAPASEEASAPLQENFMTAVETALSSREPLVGGVKATVDMSPELSSRAKRYLADHRGQSTRQVMLALFDAFLSAKGY